MGKSKVYTKKGDEGFTSLVGGKRVSKADSRIEALGTVDELNSFIAGLIETISDSDDRIFLLKIQSNLFTVCSNLASETSNAVFRISEEDISQMENNIDNIENMLPPSNRFILPGGSTGNVWANLCRTVCRRAERRIVEINNHSFVDVNILKYINRLSDYFFVFSRKQNFIHDVKENIWENPC